MKTCIYIQTKDTHESHYDGFTWGEERTGSCWYKREGEKRHIPREAGNVGTEKPKDESCLAKKGKCLPVQECSRDQDTKSRL